MMVAMAVPRHADAGPAAAALYVVVIRAAMRNKPAMLLPILTYLVDLTPL